MRAVIPIRRIKAKKIRALEIKECHINRRIPLRGKIREREVKP
jgi:hypothetical protein